MDGMAMAAPVFYAQCMCHMHTYIGQILPLNSPVLDLFTLGLPQLAPQGRYGLGTLIWLPGLACQIDWHIQADKLLNPACTCIHMVAE